MISRFTATVVAQDSDQFWGGAVAVVFLLLALAFLVFFIAALVSILKSPQSGGMKLVWVVFAFCAPFLGSLLWFAIGRKAGQTARY
jgi:hypothetical protein